MEGHKMQQGINYDETYSPVVAWPTIRLFLIIATINKSTTIQLDFIMEYTQATINKTIYLKLLPGINFSGIIQAYELLKDTEEFVWREIVRKDMVSASTRYVHFTKLGYAQLTYDKYASFKDSYIFFVHTDDGIIMEPATKTTNARIKELQSAFKIEVQSTLNDYLGIKITIHDSGATEMSKP
jgi:Reverse transcriptase (RNA-dependent DNA polymerase)